MAILNPAYNFLNSDFTNPNLTGRKVEPIEAKEGDNRILQRILTAATPFITLLTPSSVFAADTTEGTFKNIYDTAMRAFDGGVVLVFIFAGASWALGHRTKGVELLIHACCGYLLAMHATEIRDFLKTI